MKKPNLCLLIWPLLFWVTIAAGQSSVTELAVKSESDRGRAGIFARVKGKIEDTSEIRLLLKASRIYYHLMTAHGREVDTARQLAVKAYNASRKLRFDDGIVESAFLLCKIQTKLGNPVAAAGYFNLVNGEGKVRLLLVVAEYYAFNFDAETREFTRCYSFINRAQEIARSVNSERWLIECQILRGKAYMRTGDIRAGEKTFVEFITKYEKAKDYHTAAVLWSKLANNVPESQNTFKLIKKSLENSIKYYLLAGEKEAMAYILRDLALLNGNYQQLDSAEKQLLRVVSTLQSVHAPVKFTTYNLLGDFYRYDGKYDKALHYALLARKAPDFDERKGIQSSFALATIYERTGKKELALKYYLDGYREQEKLGNRAIFESAYYIGVLMADMGPAKAREGLQFLNNFVRRHKSEQAWHRQQFAYAYGDLYNALGDYRRAEQSYRRMISLDREATAELDKDIDSRHQRLPDGSSSFVIGKFYLQRKRYAEAKVFLAKAIANPQYNDAQQKRDNYQLLFKADSALGNYKSAVANLLLYKTFNDSINSVIRSKQLEELNVQYETAEKEKNIRLLKNREKLQEEIIRRSQMIRNFVIWGALMLALVLFNQYRNNKKLKRQRAEIDSKNKSLETLVSEKDSFLKEKDWLLKEIHHRVKNNLQIIISLLSTQSEYLENNAALEAIQESQHRVHSIALIHQKLYKSDNPGSISILEYVSELIENLEDGFNTPPRKIEFKKHIEAFDIDLSQAVPLGLILNESITNAIKYAFGDTGGRITVSLALDAGNMLQLIVKDNGRGLAPDFDLNHTNSLGMELIKGLTRQLRGKFELSGDKGVCIKVEFELLKPLHHQVSQDASFSKNNTVKK